MSGRRPIEAGWVCGLWTAALLLAGASAYGPWSWLGWASLAALAGGAIVLGWAAVLALRDRRWLGAAARLAALPVLLPAMLVACVLAGFAGKAGRMNGLDSVWRGSPVLPVESGAMDRLVAAGHGLARQLGEGATSPDGFALESVECSFGGGVPRVGFGFARGNPAAFRAGLRFKRSEGNLWVPDDYSASGDTATFEANRAAFEQARKNVEAPGLLDWPVGPQVETEWMQAADHLAEALTASAALGTGGASWRTESIRPTRSLSSSGRDGIAISFKAVRGRERVAYAMSDWAFDGRTARLLDVTAGVDRDVRSTSTSEHGTEARAIIEPSLAERGGLLAPSALFMSRHEAVWESCEAALPDGTVLTYRQQQAHPFLAEYHMILSIRPPDGAERDFVLPMNTGGRTAISVATGTAPDGTPAVRLEAGRHFDLGFTLRDARIIPAGSLANEQPAGVFTAVSTPLRWIAEDDESNRQLIEEARGYLR